MDKQVFVVNGFLRRLHGAVRGCRFESGTQVGPTLFELALQQQDLRPIPGGRVFWIA